MRPASEIIFKAKSVDGRFPGWVEGFLYYGCLYPTSFNAYYINDVMIDPDTICQYTGVISNGVKIFGNDLVTSSRKEFASPDDIMVINFTAGAFVLSNPKCCSVCESGKGFICFLGEELPDDLNVVGNRIDNPELIKR